jgi:hypothetical protein
MLYNLVGDNPEQKLYACINDSQKSMQPTIPSHLGRADIIDPSAYAAATERDEAFLAQYVLQRLPLLMKNGVVTKVKDELKAMSLRPIWNAFWAHPMCEVFKNIWLDESHQQCGGVLMDVTKWSFELLGKHPFTKAPSKSTKLIAELDLRAQRLSPWQANRVRCLNVFSLWLNVA